MSYIGQSTKSSIEERYLGKWFQKTHNKYLRNAVFSYGPTNFTAEIIEQNIENKHQLDELEKFFVNKFNTLYPNGYNFTSGGQALFKHHKNTKVKLSQDRAKIYFLIDCSGKEFEVANLKRFCANNNLSYPAMKNMVRGCCFSSQGYALKGANHQNIRIKKEHILISPDGKNFLFTNIKQFCEEQNLEKTAIQKLLAGKKLLPVKGWRLPKMDTKLFDKKQFYANSQLISPIGKIHKVNSPYKFALENPPLDRKDIYVLINKESKERKGWKLFIK